MIKASLIFYTMQGIQNDILLMNYDISAANFLLFMSRYKLNGFLDKSFIY